MVSVQTSSIPPHAQSSVDPAEVEQFSRIAQEWWDPKGKFKPLHDINPLRIEYITEQVCRHLQRERQDFRPLSGLKLLDIGCGGGLICEPMARLGADVTGIDASEKNIKTATVHGEEAGLSITYRASTAEQLASEGRLFDVVLALEVVEHVVDYQTFIASCAQLVRPGGVLIMTTLNRTMKSYLFAIVGAERVLQLLPRGTHQWQKFVKPSEMAAAFRGNRVEVVDSCGMVIQPIGWKWKLSASDLDVNYLMTGVRNV